MGIKHILFMNTDYFVYTTKNSAKPAVEFQIGPCRLTLGLKVVNLLSFQVDQCESHDPTPVF